MCTRGVWQLRRLVVNYKKDDSCPTLREWITKGMIGFANKNPQIEIVVNENGSQIPSLRGEYLSGRWKEVPITKKMTPSEIHEEAKNLRNSSGYPMPPAHKFGSQWFSDNPSVQGVWRPNSFAAQASYLERVARGDSKVWGNWFAPPLSKLQVPVPASYLEKLQTLLKAKQEQWDPSSIRAPFPAVPPTPGSQATHTKQATK
eukprot:TRINITY_DN17028_c0_g1::TRINITY_DN17028_c0_g1_i1::g.20986::m.20986 TRINITY_DN17028_c0_g1::TRINITY_DN17028_c0_g1_i1::g.20986  ORF type:complete len:202 (-),score=3.15,sp/Q8N983/RM43_HUMAN/33.62/3e-10,L51_S25_CI-B8/PF05047.11/7.8e-08,L51_S25_CI-B8/PF05047.11/1.3e+04,HTH_Tnp_Tc5/PF03221.11/0.095 TRINITY_DN17028_c0_g1_i1:4-609(-)